MNALIRCSNDGSQVNALGRPRLARWALVALAALAGCKEPSPSGPHPTAMSPDRGAQGSAVAVTITGDGFAPVVHTDFQQASQSRLEARYVARLGLVPLGEVQLTNEGALTAVVPETLEPGLYALTVVDPQGRAGELRDAYRVVAGDEGSELVASFRFAPVATQAAHAPFGVTLEALDGAGQVVPSFNGKVTLTDRTATAVPNAVGYFVAGRWAGPVEVRRAHAADALTATHARGATGTSNDFAVTALPVAAVHFASAPRSVVAGECSPPVTVELVDELGQPTPAEGATVLQLSSSQPAGFGLFSDPACAAPATSATLAAGALSATFYFRGTRAGPLTLFADAASLRGELQVEQVLAAAPVKLVFNTAGQVLNAGACSSAATVEAEDGFGNPSPLTAAATVALAAAPAAGFALWSDAACTQATASAAMAAGQATASFYFSGTVAQSVTVTATLAALPPATQDERITPAGAAARLAYVTAPQSVPAGTCSGSVALQTQDSFGNPVASPGTVQVSLTATPGAGFALFADPLCATPVGALDIVAGSSTRAFYFLGQQAGTVAVLATATGLNSATQLETITPGAPAQLAFGTAPQTQLAGACSGATTVLLQDALGNPAPAAAAGQLGLTAAPVAGLTFYSDAACTLAVTSLPVAASASAATFRFRGTLAGPVTLSASMTGLTSAAQVQTVNPGSPSKLAFSSASQTLPAGSCSGAVTVQTRDAFNNVTAVAAPATLALAAAPATGFTFFRDAACTVAATTATLGAGATTASFFFSAQAATSESVTASSTGLAPATQAETVTAAAPDRLVFTTAAQSRAAGACSGLVTVQTRDPFQNPSSVTAAKTVSLTASPAAGFTFYSNATCTSAITTVALGVGASTANLYFKGTVAGAVGVTAAAPGLTAALQSETVTAAPPDRLAFSTAAQSLTAGACSALATVRSRDPFGNASAVAAATPVNWTAAPATGFTFYSDAACTAALTSTALAVGSSQTSVYFRSTATGAITVTAAATGLASANQVETLTAGTIATQLVFTTAPQTLAAQGCSAAATVQTQNSLGVAINAPAPVTVSLAALPAAGFAFFSDAACTVAVTQVTVATGASTASFYFHGTAAGPIVVTAASTGLNDAVQTQTVTAAAATVLAFVTTPQTLTAGACSLIATVESRDAFGNPSAVPAGASVGLAAAPATGFTFYSDPACTAVVSAASLPPAGTTASFYFIGTKAGAVQVTASSAGFTSAVQTDTFTAGAPDHLAFTSAPQTLLTGACSAQGRLETTDPYGNPSAVGAATTVTLTDVPSAGFSFYSDSACTLASATFAIASGASTGGFYFRSTAVGSFQVTAAATGMTSAQQTETVNPSAPTHLSFTTTGQTRTAGSCSGIVTVRSEDAFSNASPVAVSTPVPLTTLPTTGFTFFSDSGCTAAITQATLAASASTASFYFIGTRSGTTQVTAAATGLTSATQNQTITAGALAGFTWGTVTSPRGDGTAFAVTVRATDVYGNRVSSFTGTATLTVAPAGAVACTTSCTSGTVTGNFNFGTWTGSLTLTGAVGTGRSLTATSGALTGTSNLFDVEAPPARSPPLARFTVSPAVIVLGQSINFDASTSSDVQTPTASLQVSWDFSGVAAGGPPWSAFTTLKTASNLYPAAGTYYPRLAVRDADGDLAYATRVVVVLPDASNLCIVNTSSSSDDGASSCAGPFGTDGKLSLREAVRLSNTTAGKQTITFSGPMTISSGLTWTVSASVDVVAPAGVIIDSAAIDVTAGAALWAGLEWANNDGALSVQPGAQLSITDSYLHDLHGVHADGAFTLERSRMVRCTNHCIRLGAATGSVAARFAEFRDGAAQGIEVMTCPAGVGVDVWSSTFIRMALGIESACAGTMSVQQNTFHGCGTALTYSAGAAQVLRNNLFTSNDTAVVCGAATFTNRDFHGLFANTVDGCVAGDPGTLTSDPLYVFRAVDDYHLVMSSPAVDSATPLGLDVNGPGPGSFLGAGPDRGGLESY